MYPIFRGAPSLQGCRLLQNRIPFKKPEEILKSAVYQTLLNGISTIFYSSDNDLSLFLSLFHKDT